MSLYKQTPDGPWWVSITHPNAPRVRRSTGTVDKKEAQRIHDEIKAELWKITPKLSGKTWGMAVMKWVSKETRSDSELLSLAKLGRIYTDRALTSMTRESIHSALAFCKTAGTYTRYRTMIMAILNVAKDEGWLREVPKLATKTDKKTKPREWITQEQWTKLYAELPGHLKPMAAFAISTGLRQSNVLGLRWDRVDLERRLVWVEAEDTKADKALAVPLNDDALEVLTARRVRGEHDEWVFTFRGKPIKDVKTAFIAACIRAGVGQSTKTGYVGFTWHGFRHTWATWHIQHGTPLEVLMRLGGWSDMRMVLNYAQHSPGHLASYANNVRKK
jgi:integrase